MVRVLLCSLALLLLVDRSAAWWFFSSSGRQEAEAPVDEVCVQRAVKGECLFFTCFDRRHPCDDHNYALHYGWRFCTRFDLQYRRLTPQAQRWVNATRRCAMEELLHFYRDDFINCEDVEAEMVEAQGRCEAQHGLCSTDLIRENSDVFGDIYAADARSARRLLQAIKHCGASRARRIVGWLGERYSSLVPDIADFFQGLRDRITDVIQGVLDDDDDEDRK